MKYIVMECRFSYAVLLDEDGKFLKAANLGYQVGQTVYDPVLVGAYRYRPSVTRLIARVAGLILLAVAIFWGVRCCDGFSPSSSNDPTVTISADRAKEIALDHAGLTADGVVFESAELDEEDGVPIYELDFIANGIEYEYEIRADDGTIIGHQCEPVS